MEGITNRKAETFCRMFKKNINSNLNLLIKTGAHPSYPRAANYIVASHEAVNHSNGFKNENGSTANEIEIPWSHFKQIYKKISGLNKGKLENFIYGFYFRRTVIKSRNSESFAIGFDYLINLPIEENNSMVGDSKGQLNILTYIFLWKPFIFIYVFFLKAIYFDLFFFSKDKCFKSYEEAQFKNIHQEIFQFINQKNVYQSSKPILYCIKTIHNSGPIILIEPYYVKKIKYTNNILIIIFG